MKKIYLTIFTIVAGVASVFAQTVPTCSLNPTFIASNKIGIWPDSVTNFISGVVGTPYEQNLTIKVPKDTVSSGTTFCFNRFVFFIDKNGLRLGNTSHEHHQKQSQIIPHKYPKTKNEGKHCCLYSLRQLCCAGLI